MSAAPGKVPAAVATPIRILLVAGEASGDLHGAALVSALRTAAPAIEVSGVGGQHLRAAGMNVLVDTAHVATMGLTETLGTLGRLLGTYRRLLRFLDEQRPALLILVDYPEFNLLLARQAKRRGIAVFYFIGPQVWAWRRGRVRKIAARVDRMAVVFPFEPELYNRDGRRLAEFVGHPLLDRVGTTRPRDETLRRHGLDPQRRTLAILPGSRKKEIRYLLEPSLGAAQRLVAEDGWQAVIALAPTLTIADLQHALGRELPVPVALDDTYNVVSAADAALVASGTATVETALLGCPMVIMYRVSALTFAVARRLVDVEFIGMPNIICGRAVFPELIQEEVTPAALVAAVRALAGQATEQRAALATVRERLGQPGAAQRAAAMVLELLR
ncbi:MAG: lipid-A-disaccharide synthase [Deltaproteobacteria bacterium]|nr:lipid-A-disaccharide synthase [Deltaproteobacteria bacterium]